MKKVRDRRPHGNWDRWLRADNRAFTPLGINGLKKWEDRPQYKPCKLCGKLFTRRYPIEFQRAEFCGRRCAKLHRHGRDYQPEHWDPEAHSKVCAADGCDNTFTARSYGEFQKRRYCSRACGGKARKGTTFDRGWVYKPLRKNAQKQETVNVRQEERLPASDPRKQVEEFLASLAEEQAKPITPITRTVRVRV